MIIIDNILNKTVEAVQNSEIAFSKYITPNDTGTTGAHQAGYHIHKSAWGLFFDSPGIKGDNREKFVTIRWQNDFETSSRFIYYGRGTRNEYRLTRFGKGFPYLSDDNVGDLLIIAKKSSDYYEAFVLQTDEQIDNFFALMNISSTDTNGIIPRHQQQTEEDRLIKCFQSFINNLSVNFPSTTDLASRARYCYNNAYNITSDKIKANPDKELLGWVKAEFQLFKEIENNRYKTRIQTPFSSVEELVETANTILNRRKSRAGKSLEHHLSEVFNTFQLKYENQAITEDNKKPDFLFPGRMAYLDPNYDKSKIIVLASKTTCKDRWRQVLNEADRIETKHLFTLQQGISKNQLKEMYKSKVCLVVPKPYLNSFPQEYRNKIKTLDAFINQVKGLQL